MQHFRPYSAVLTKTLIALLVVVGSACTTNEPRDDSADMSPIEETEITATEPVPVPVLKPDTVASDPTARIPMVSPKPRVAIVISDNSPAYQNIASALILQFDNPRVYSIADSSTDISATFDEINTTMPSAVVAIGLSAALVAERRSRVPVVFCQVFNVPTSMLLSDNVKGVSSIPPLGAQFGVWKQLDPALERVGTILGEGHDGLIAEAVEATGALGIKLHHRVARSDRETLYLFKRLVADIDGYLLFPDSRILSSAVIRQMFVYAAQRNVQIAVFNPSLLSLGATVSFSARDADVASTVLSVVEGLSHSDEGMSAAITPLSALDVHVNSEAAISKTLNSLDTESWRVSVHLREGDKL